MWHLYKLCTYMFIFSQSKKNNIVRLSYLFVQRIMGSRKCSLGLMYIIAAYKQLQPHKHTVLKYVYMTVNVCSCL